MGNTTDKMKKGMKDAAGAVKHAVEKGKECCAVASWIRATRPANAERSLRETGPLGLSPEASPVGVERDQTVNGLRGKLR